MWISCRTRSQRDQIRSLKLPTTATGYYRSCHDISLAAIYPQLRTIYIDIWRIVGVQTQLEGLSQEHVMRLLAAEKVKACQKEGGSVKIVATECVYRMTPFGPFLDPA